MEHSLLEYVSLVKQ